MLRLINIEINNFRSIEKANFSMEALGLIQVSGVNTDDELSPSNGAGKSTLKSALCWNLFGYTETGKKADSILSWFNPKNCSVITTWKINETDVVKITRYRAHKEFENDIHIHMNDTKISEVDNKLTQKHIEKIIGFNYDLFCLLLTTGMTSKNLLDFMLMSDTERKAFIDFILTLDWINTAKDKVKKDIDDVEKSVQKINNEIESRKEFKTSLIMNLTDLENKEASFEQAKEADIQKYVDMLTKSNEEAKTQYAELQVKLKEEAHLVCAKPNSDVTTLIEKTIEGLLSKKKTYSDYMMNKSKDRDVAQREIFETQSALSKIKGQIPIEILKEVEVVTKELYTVEITQKAFNTLKSDPNEFKQKLLADWKISNERLELEKDKTFLVGQLQIASQKLVDINRILLDYEDLKGDCPTCKQPISKEHIDKCVETVTKDKVKFELEIKEIETKIAEVNEKLKKVYFDLQESTKKSIEQKLSELFLLSNELQGKLSLLEEKKQSAIQESINKEAEQLKNRLANANATFETVCAEIGVTVKNHDEVEKLLQEGRDNLQATQKLFMEWNTNINNLQTEIAKLKHTYKNTLAVITMGQSQLNAIKLKQNPYAELKQLKAAEIHEIDCKNKLSQDSLESFRHRIKLLKFWEVGFGNSGIKSFILDSITDLLNNKSNYCLSKLTQNIQVQFNTQDRTKAGELREKFTVEIKKDGRIADYTDLSKGERVRVSFAVNFALKALARSYHNIYINFNWLDEVLDGLDEIGCYQVIQFLREELTNYESILLVSHNSHVTGLFDKNVIIEKENGRSKIRIE